MATTVSSGAFSNFSHFLIFQSDDVRTWWSPHLQTLPGIALALRPWVDRFSKLAPKNFLEASKPRGLLNLSEQLPPSLFSTSKEDYAVIVERTFSLRRKREIGIFWELKKRLVDVQIYFCLRGLLLRKRKWGVMAELMSSEIDYLLKLVPFFMPFDPIIYYRLSNLCSFELQAKLYKPTNYKHYPNW